MGKQASNKKLSLNRETLKKLSRTQLGEAAGGKPTALCTNGAYCESSLHDSGCTGCNGASDNCPSNFRC